MIRNSNVLSYGLWSVIMLDVGRKCSNVDFKAFVLPCWRKKAKSNAISTRSKLTVGMRILNLTLAASLVLLSNDVQLNPGPFMSPICSGNVSSCGSSVSLADNDSFEYGQYDDNSYFDLGLDEKGLRIGIWNVNYLTSDKFDQIKLFLIPE